MKAAWVDAARRDEVREAAAGWKSAGAIDAATLAAIEAESPAGGRALAPFWRVVIFVLVSVAVNTLFAGAFTFASGQAIAPALLVYGAILGACAEAARSSRFHGTAAPPAIAFWAAVDLTVGFGALLTQNLHVEDKPALTLAFAFAAAAFGLADARWGYAAFGVLSTVALFLFLARFPEGRLLWAAAGALVVIAATRRLDRSAFAPPHRRTLEGILVVGAVAFYAAVNLYSVDRGFVESLRSFSENAPPRPAAVRLLAAVGTAVVPAVFVGWGIRSRRRLLLGLGGLLAVCSLVTLRYYVHLAPIWSLLAACGAALILGALALNRWLRNAPGGERNGYTVSPLFSGIGSGGVSAAAAVVGFAPGLGPAPELPAGDYSPGGGRYGGGGASGSF